MGATSSSFSTRELSTLKRMFKHLAALSPDKKSMDRHTFLKLFEREWQVDGTAAAPMPHSGPLISERMFAFFDKNKSGTIDMQEWLVALSRFMRGSEEDFLRVVFEIYDLDGKEAISRDEFRLLISHLPAETLATAKQQLQLHHNAAPVVRVARALDMRGSPPSSGVGAPLHAVHDEAVTVSHAAAFAADEHEEKEGGAVVGELIAVAYSAAYDTDRSGVLPFDQFRLFLQHAPALCDVLRDAVPWQQLQAGSEEGPTSWVPSYDADCAGAGGGASSGVSSGEEGDGGDPESPRALTPSAALGLSQRRLSTGAYVFGLHHPSGTSGTVWKVGRVTGRWVRRFAWTWGNLLYYWETARSSPLVSPQIRESPKGIIFMPEHVARNAEGDDVARLAKEKGVFGFVVETRKRPWERDVKGIKATKKRVWYVETAASRDAWVVALRNAARLRAIEDRYLIDWSPTGLLGSGATADVRRCSKVERARGRGNSSAASTPGGTPRGTPRGSGIDGTGAAAVTAGLTPGALERRLNPSTPRTPRVIGDEGAASGAASSVSSTTTKAFAVKIFRKEAQGALIGDRRGAFERLRVEIAVLKLLRHPHILPLLDWFEDETNVYVVTPLIEKGELFTQLIGQQRRTEQQAYFVIRPILSAVAFMHSKGVAHRDLKLENILVGERGVEVGDIIIADLGLSRILSKPEDGEHGMTYMCGSSGYVAPEVIRSATDASGRALFTSKPTAGYGLKVDVWSVGVILHTLVYGSRPYEGAPADMVRYLVSDKAADDAAAKIPQGILDPEGGGDRVWKTTSAALRDFLRCLLQKKPDARISASEALMHPWISEQRALVDAAVAAAATASATLAPEAAEAAPAAAAPAALTGAAEEEAADKPGKEETEEEPAAAVEVSGAAVAPDALAAALRLAAPPADEDAVPSAAGASAP